MADIFGQLYSINIVSYVGVEDFADRLSFLFTVTLLSVCCLFTAAMSYVVRPIVCFLPNTFGEFFDGKELFGQIDYATNFCWTEGTYAVHPHNFSIDGTAKDGGLGVYADRKIVYYQWVPFLLAVQGILFYLPRLMWHSISYDRAGTDVGHIVKIASDASREDEETHDKLVTYACRMIEVMLDKTVRQGAASGQPPQSPFVRIKSDCSKCISVAMPSRLSGSWLILTYFFIKLAYLINAIGQLVLMQYFLQLSDKRYSMLGVQLLRDIVSGNDWQNSMVFPRVGCCAVFFRSAAGGNWQFSQCTLPVNIINEKVYIFLWFWFVFVAAATLASTVAWIYRVVNVSLTCRFVKKYLRLADNYAELKNRRAITRGFLHQFLRRDGAFVLKMIALNAGDVICAEIIQRLWRHYLVYEGFDCVDPNAVAAASDEGAAAQAPETGILRLSCNQLPAKKQQQQRPRVRRDVSFYLDDDSAAAVAAGPAGPATAACSSSSSCQLPATLPMRQLGESADAAAACKEGEADEVTSL